MLNTHCRHRLYMTHIISVSADTLYRYVHHCCACVRAPWFFLDSPPPRACSCLPLYIIRPYNRASRDVSGLPGPGRSCIFFLLLLLLVFPRVGSSPGASSPSCAHLRSALRNDHRSGGGWMGGWTDGCGCRVESPSSVTVITSTFGLPPF